MVSYCNVLKTDTWTPHFLELPLDTWTPFVGETLFLRKEPANPIDKHTVAAFKDGVVVGHVPYNKPPHAQFIEFLTSTDTNKAFTEVVNMMGAGYGLEVLCMFCLYGPKVYIDEMKKTGPVCC